MDIISLKNEIASLKKQNSGEEKTVEFKKEGDCPKKDNSVEEKIPKLEKEIESLNAQINELKEQKEIANKFIK